MSEPAPRTLAEQLDAAQTGDEFGQVLKGLFSLRPDDVHDAAWEDDE